MQFKINRNTLLNNLLIVQKGLPTKTPLPVLNNFKIEVLKEKIILSSNNNDISIQIIIKDDLVTLNEGNFLISGKYLIDIVRKIESDEITFSLIEDNIIIISADNIEFKLRLMDFNDYPEISFLNDYKNPLKLTSGLLKKIIKQSSFAASTSEKRPILTGVNLKYQNNLLTITATDSYRLSQSSIKIQSTCENFEINIPAKSLDDLSKILDLTNEDILIFPRINKVLFKIDNILFQARLLEGKYPDVERIIPSEFPVIIPFNRETILAAVERVSILAPREKDSNSNIIKISLNEDLSVQIHSNNFEIGDAIENVIPSDKVTGKIFNISFSSKHFSDALKVINSAEIIIKFSGEVKPFIVEGVNEEKGIHLILPVRID